MNKNNVVVDYKTFHKHWLNNQIKQLALKYNLSHKYVIDLYNKISNNK